jgi:uncharacterized protein RhaS with RHS repeats
MVYLRARYYDPFTQQFISRDPLEGTTGQPYAYAYGNPLNFVDPAGLEGGFWGDELPTSGAGAAYGGAEAGFSPYQAGGGARQGVGIGGDAVTASGVVRGPGIQLRMAEFEGLSYVQAEVQFDLPLQLHHFATNKHSKYTPLFSRILKRYGLDLEGSWNTEYLPHRGRHPNSYHEFVFEGMQRADLSANGHVADFLSAYELYVKQPVRDNPMLLTSKGW